MNKAIASNDFFLSALGVLFIGLKLTGYIHWSWWLVTLPLWGLAALIILAVVCAFLVACYREYFG